MGPLDQPLTVFVKQISQVLKDKRIIIICVFRAQCMTAIKFNGYIFRGSNLAFSLMLPFAPLTLLHSERPKLDSVLAFLSAVGFKRKSVLEE